ncbi:MAG: extensin family protein [Proteobacteria bacterium]|nr:extensin family protein [Burkholderiales bacterium]
MKAVVAALALAALLAFAAHGRFWQLPDRHNPWAPLTVDEPPGWLTRYKLARLDKSPAACNAALATAVIAAEPVPDRETAPDCGFRNAVRVRSTRLQVGEPFTLSCRAAVSLVLWERHVLEPEALRTLGEPLKRIEHYGSYACRNINGRDQGTRSRHATADALDVAGFVLASGRRITVARHWRGDNADARFLQAIHRGGCRFFDVVLGPDYNRAHADHLHLDRGPNRLCR